jgi:outer membrane protein OmpA-like peptidoglycan-associated protein
MKQKILSVLIIAVFAFTGCSAMSKRAKCACVGAAAGAAVGTTAGLIIGHDVNLHRNANMAGGGIIGGVAGAVIGGVTGYLVCKEEPKPEPVQPVRAEMPMCDKIVLNSVHFDFDKSVIKPEYYQLLDEAITELQKCPKKSVVIEGNTCNMGSDNYNMKLSERRALSVKKYLMEKGLVSDRFTVKALGETNPIADNKTKKGRIMNRRVEFKVD